MLLFLLNKGVQGLSAKQYISPSQSLIRMLARTVCKHIASGDEPALTRQDVDEFTTFLELIFDIHVKLLNATD